MIKSIAHKGLRALWEEGKTSKLPADQVPRIEDILMALDKVKEIPGDLLLFHSWKIHPLKGNLKGYWSLTVKANWRIIFRWNGKDVLDVDYLDYH